MAAMTACAREFAQLLGPLRRAVLKSTRQTAGLPDLPEAQIEVLRLLGDGPTAPSQIAAALRLAPSTLSNLLKTMDDGGLIERVRHRDDQRRVEVVMSTRARKLLDTYDATSLSAIEQFLGQLTGEERAAFEATVPILQRMCAAFDGG
ncbi:MarR family transcriptional regulator [Mycobacteroides abscessus subsp. abscessus]|nr:MarR family transcriptional regulator [Mycobacteroides abscessus subsp. abscessus]